LIRRDRLSDDVIAVGGDQLWRSAIRSSSAARARTTAT
jgi:hypothetical protein